MVLAIDFAEFKWIKEEMVWEEKIEHFRFISRN